MELVVDFAINLVDIDGLDAFLEPITLLDQPFYRFGILLPLVIKTLSERGKKVPA